MPPNGEIQEMSPRKNSEKSETVINTWVSIIKQQWKKIIEIPEEHDFLTVKGVIL